MGAEPELDLMREGAALQSRGSNQSNTKKVAAEGGRGLERTIANNRRALAERGRGEDSTKPAVRDTSGFVPCWQEKKMEE